MNRSNTLEVIQPEWMDLKTAVRYACVSERSIREWIHLPVDPLPAVQVNGGKLLINRTRLDRWLESHPYQSLQNIDVDQVVDEVLNDFKKAA